MRLFLIRALNHLVSTVRNSGGFSSNNEEEEFGSNNFFPPVSDLMHDLGRERDPSLGPESSCTKY